MALLTDGLLQPSARLRHAVLRGKRQRRRPRVLAAYVPVAPHRQCTEEGQIVSIC